jgi:hypothetical protein
MYSADPNATAAVAYAQAADAYKPTAANLPSVPGFDNGRNQSVPSSASMAGNKQQQNGKQKKPSSGKNKQKNKQQKNTAWRSAGGHVWEDKTLKDWDPSKSQ